MFSLSIYNNILYSFENNMRNQIYLIIYNYREKMEQKYGTNPKKKKICYLNTQMSSRFLKKLPGYIY